MAAGRSAGVVLYRVQDGTVEVLIGHPGGPFWAGRDDGAWSIPKGEYDPEDSPWEAAVREFAEELGCPVPRGPVIALGDATQPGGKRVTIFAVGADLDISRVHSNTFTLEWPRGSGRLREYPELDRVAWLPVAQARRKLLRGQREFLDRLMASPEVAGFREGR